MDDRFEEILDEAAVLAELDAARAEVWVSGLLAEWDDDADLLARLAASARPEAAAVACAAPAMLPGAAEVVAALVDAGAALPEWASVVGTATAQLAWAIVDPFSGNVSIVVEYEHADEARHSMLVEVEGAAAVDIHFGPPGLVDAAFDESDTRTLSVQELTVDEALVRIAAALAHTAARGAADEVEVTDEFVMNRALAVARVAGVQVDVVDPGPAVVAATEVAEPLDRRRTRDAYETEADAAACATLRGALVAALAAPAPAVALTAQAAQVRASLAAHDDPDLDALAADAGVTDSVATDASRLDDAALLARLAGAFVVPGPLAAFMPSAREAIRGIEWADWLGAVLPLVRAGVGAEADPMQLVRNINRCPEVTTTVPKRDMPAVAEVFSRTLHAWELTGVIDADGRLTALGAWLLPRALLDAWGEPAGGLSGR